MNIVMEVGRLVRDPGYSNGVLKFTLAVDRAPDKNGNKATDYPEIVVFGRQAEAGSKYLRKGRQVAIEGTIKTGSYQTDDGRTIYTQDIVAYRVEYCGSRQNAEPKAETKPEPKPEPEQIDVTELDDNEPF